MVSVQTFKSELFKYTETFKTVFLKHFMKVAASTNKDINVKVGYQKRCCCLSK